jgi:hypothetical protein
LDFSGLLAYLAYPARLCASGAGGKCPVMAALALVVFRQWPRVQPARYRWRPARAPSVNGGLSGTVAGRLRPAEVAAQERDIPPVAFEGDIKDIAEEGHRSEHGVHNDVAGHSRQN